jgi:hypothetical protein
MNAGFSRGLALLAAAVAVTISATFGPRSDAATITDVNATWPASPAVQSVNALAVVHANRGISGTRVNRQSITVAADVTVGAIYLSAANYNNNAFLIKFFPVPDVNASPLDLTGVQVGPTITVDAQGAAAAGDRNLRIALTGAEQVTLTAAAAPAGYYMQIELADTASAAAFNWVHANSGTNEYLDGRYRRDDGNQDATRDYGLALVAVPEPVSLAMAALVVPALAVRRRRRRR